MNNENKFYNLSYQIIDLLQRDLIKTVLKGDSFLIKSKQLKIIDLCEKSKIRFKEILQECSVMGFEVSFSPNHISISLPLVESKNSWSIIEEFSPSIAAGSGLGELIDSLSIADVLINDIKKNKNQWIMDEEQNLINDSKKIMITFRLSGSGIIFIRIPLFYKQEITSDYFELSAEESLKLVSFVDSYFSFDLSKDNVYLKRVKNLKKILE